MCGRRSCRPSVATRANRPPRGRRRRLWVWRRRPRGRLPLGAGNRSVCPVPPPCRCGHANICRGIGPVRTLRERHRSPSKFFRPELQHGQIGGRRLTLRPVEAFLLLVAFAIFGSAERLPIEIQGQIAEACSAVSPGGPPRRGGRARPVRSRRTTRSRTRKTWRMSTTHPASSPWSLVETPASAASSARTAPPRMIFARVSRLRLVILHNASQQSTRALRTSWRRQMPKQAEDGDRRAPSILGDYRLLAAPCGFFGHVT